MNSFAKFDIPESVEKAVRHYWSTREAQNRRQGQAGKRDQGARSAVTGGAQMNGFTSLFRDAALAAGISANCIHHDSRVELPGFFRAEKKWDTVIVAHGDLLAVIEAKSQVGPSFGNNFNNRVEEAIGSATDIWTAFREGKFSAAQPWLGYLFLLEDCEESRKAVKVVEPHFPVFAEFNGASYARRYEIFCRKLVRERLYTSTAFLTSSAAKGIRGVYSQPAPEHTVERFIVSLVSHLKACVDLRG